LQLPSGKTTERHNTMEPIDDKPDISRRGILRTAAGITALGALPMIASASSAPKTIRPKRMKTGDTFGLIAPASATGDENQIQTVIARMEALGFKVKQAKNLREKYGYLAGTDNQRAEDFNAMVRDPEVDGILCYHGGYGTMRMLPQIDYNAFKNNPKVVVGYSDITGLLMALNAKTGVIGFHGPVGNSTWSIFDTEWFKKAAFTAAPIGTFGSRDQEMDPLPETLVEGVGEGRLLGGNLTLISHLIGTPYFPDPHGAIWCLEDIGEDPYKVDRMLTHMWLAGAFKGAQGIVFGSVRPRAADPARTPSQNDFSMIEVLRDRTKRFGLPSYSGFSFGHIENQVTVPIGVRARIDAAARTLRVLEPAVK
jgi:muramoyltetrapeptide carboxypeptidase